MVLFVDEFKQLGEGTDRLGVPQHEKAPRPQRIMQNRDHTVLQYRTVINQNVATTDQVELRKRRVAGDVLSGEDARVANGLDDLIAGVGFDEELADPF